MTKKYNWELRAGSRKEICPNCGQRRFVPYVSVRDHATMAGEQYGRCDREQHCGYHRYPSKDVSSKGIATVVLPEEEPIRFSPVVAYASPKSALFEFFLDTFGTEKTLKAWNAYKVGADRGRAVFWQIDRHGEVRAGKSIPYKSDGHRDKSDPFPASWVHKSPYYRGAFTGTKIQQCLFGEHLLTIHPEKNVAVVESEKTALAMSIIQPDYIWVATGGSNGLNEGKCKALFGRNVRLFPDHGKWYDWSVIAQKHGFDIDDFVERNPLFDGCDILDYYV